MRVLVLHSHYLSGAASGENRVVEDEVRLLREAGHEVDLWSPEPDVRGLSLLRTGIRAVWSRAAADEVRSRIRRGRIDVVHCHNLFPTLSPAVMPAAAAEGAAVVMTLHNYRLLCLPATLRRDGDNCQACVGKTPWRGVVHRCYRDSLPGSGALALSLVLARWRHIFDRAGLFLPVSDFVRDKYVEAGFPGERLRVKPNFTWPIDRREGPGEYFLFLGRLSSEKGMDMLLRAWEGRSERLLVVGDGPQGEELRRSAPPSVEFVGTVSGAEVPALLASARALLVPSRWPDSAPRVVVEAYAAGVAVLASAVGGLPELIAHGESGLLLEDGAASWGDGIDRLLDDGESTRLGEGAWRAWSDRFAPAAALANLTSAYEAAAGQDSAPVEPAVEAALRA